MGPVAVPRAGGYPPPVRRPPWVVDSWRGDSDPAPFRAFSSRGNPESLPILLVRVPCSPLPAALSTTLLSVAHFLKIGEKFSPRFRFRSSPASPALAFFLLAIPSLLTPALLLLAARPASALAPAVDSRSGPTARVCEGGVLPVAQCLPLSPVPARGQPGPLMRLAHSDAPSREGRPPPRDAPTCSNS